MITTEEHPKFHDQRDILGQDRERYRGATTLTPRPREPRTMSNGPNQGDESTSTADLSTPTEPDVTDLDLRADSPEPDSELLPAVPTPPSSQPVAEATTAESQVTLASLAFRLFSTIDDQLARDPNSATLTGLASRLDVLERGVASSISKADALTGLSNRLDDIDAQLAAPDPHAGALSSLNDRLARVEHRLAAPHPHTATINSLVERMDEAEAKGTPRNISVLTERLDMVEGRVPAPEDLIRLTDRVTAIERRLTAPEVIAGLQQQLQEVEIRFALLDEPAEQSRAAARLPLYVLAILAIVAIAIVILIAMT